MLTRHKISEHTEGLILNGNKVIPMCGNILLEIVKEDIHKYKAEKEGLAKTAPTLTELGFEIKREIVRDYAGNIIDNPVHVPFTKGKVIDIAKDAYSSRYKHNYGEEAECPIIGDIVMFVRNQQYNVEPSGTYALVPDERVVCILREVKE